MIRRARLLAVLGIVASGAVGVISATQTWLLVTLDDGAVDDLAVSGAAAVPVLAPLSLAVLALGLALSIVGTVLRYVLGALAVLAAGALLGSTGSIVFTLPESAAASTVTEATGITGSDAVTELVSRIAPTAWPAVTLAASLLLLAAGVFTLITARSWRGAGRRFRTDAASGSASAAPASPTADEAPGPLDAVDSWDGLSRGEDPTAPGGRR